MPTSKNFNFFSPTGTVVLPEAGVVVSPVIAVVKKLGPGVADTCVVVFVLDDELEVTDGLGVTIVFDDEAPRIASKLFK